METHKVNHDRVFGQMAALFLAATSPTANPNEADNAFRAIRSRICNGNVDPHVVADRIRGCGSFAPSFDPGPALVAMPIAMRRIWIDTICLRMPLSAWERKFVADIRGRILSSSCRVSPAQIRTLQALVDRAWQTGVRP